MNLKVFAVLREGYYAFVNMHKAHVSNPICFYDATAECVTPLLLQMLGQRVKDRRIITMDELLRDEFNDKDIVPAYMRLELSTEPRPEDDGWLHFIPQPTGVVSDYKYLVHGEDVLFCKRDTVEWLHGSPAFSVRVTGAFFCDYGSYRRTHPLASSDRADFANLCLIEEHKDFISFNQGSNQCSES